MPASFSASTSAGRKVLLAVAMALVASMAPVAFAASVEAAPVPGGRVDITNATAGINDPVASLAPLSLDCAPGQIDINTASAQDISVGLSLPSDPTVNRLIAMRPWLKGSDLSSVPGIGPELIPFLAPRVCASPVVTPIATPLACEPGSKAIDLQSASAAAIAKSLKVNATVANGIVGARPLSQDLFQYVPPRVPGFSSPLISDLLRAKRVCVTPAPYRFGGTTYRWATAAGGAVVEDGLNALIIPAGRITQWPGAWGAITPLPPADDVLPGADAHIFGTWAPEVAVRLPRAVNDGTGAPLVFHTMADGTEAISAGADVFVSGGTITSARLSLSDGYNGTSACPDPGSDQVVYGCPTGARDEILKGLLSKAADNYLLNRWGSLIVPGPCPDNSDLIVTSGGGALSCSAVASGNKANWTFENPSVPLLTGGVFRPRLEGEGTLGSITPPAITDFSSLVAVAYAQLGLIAPGSRVAVTKSQGASTSTFHLDASAKDNAAFYAFMNSAGQISSIGGEMGVGLAAELPALAQSCGATAASASLLISCMYTVADQHLDDLERFAETRAKSEVVDSAGYRRWKGLEAKAASVQRINKIAQLTDLILSVSQVLNPPEFALTYLNPAPTGGTGSGGTAKFIARADGNPGPSWLVDPATKTAAPIDEGSVFNCLAQRMFVRDLVDTYRDGSNRLVLVTPAGRIVVNNPADNLIYSYAACDTGIQPVWDYLALAEGGRTPNNVIIKMPDNLGTGAWLINSAGEIQTITDVRDPNGNLISSGNGIYKCLTQYNPVIYNFPFEKVQAWQNVGDAPASCG